MDDKLLSEVRTQLQPRNFSALVRELLLGRLLDKREENER